MATDFTVTGCIDCNAVKALPANEINEQNPVFMFGGAALKMWRDMDQKHHLIVVSTRPERVFLSCQPFAKLCSEDGIAAILNFVERIKPEQELKDEPVA